MSRSPSSTPWRRADSAPGPFGEELASHRSDERGRRWIYAPYDQLGAHCGPLAESAPRELGLVLIESRSKAERRPYHKQKLALVLANQRRFALEQARRGVAVRYLLHAGDPGEVLEASAAELGPLALQEPAERELRHELAPLVERGALHVLENEFWLTRSADFEASVGQGPPWRMDRFYRHLRRSRKLLMEADGSPVGGQFSFDADNRRPWRGDPPAPEPPRFRVDALLREVGELIECQFAAHPGQLDLGALPTSARHAQSTWAWAREQCLPAFGPYEDAFSQNSRGLFHTRLSPLINLGRLSAQQVLDEALTSDAPLASVEGFVRQLLGWREFVRHVHRASDGFRTWTGPARQGAEGAGDGGWARATDPAAPQPEPDSRWAGAWPSFLEAHEPLPAAYWGAPSGLACLDRVVREVWEDGYVHHIERLMILSNFATLLGVEPRELTDWFWVGFLDAYDWVVEPNVLAMGSFAVGDWMTTKPYVSGAAYLARMGDDCSSCAFDPKRDCPFARLYWAFLERNAERLRGNPRVAMPLRSVARRSATERAADAALYEHVRARLGAGLALSPEGLAG